MNFPSLVTSLYKTVTSHETTQTIQLRAFGLAKIPLLFLISPKVLQVSHERAALKVPLNWLTKNHWGSMYFGVLSIGADCAAGLLAMKFIKESEQNVTLLFKDFHADFLKRADEDVIFSCDDGRAVRDLVEAAITSGERVNAPIHVTAWLASKPSEDPIAKFVLTMSLKVKN